MKKNIIYITGIVLFFSYTSCKENDAPIQVATYNYQQPQYNNVSLEIGSDTMHFALSDTSYNKVGIINLFTDKGVEYISIFDTRSEAINIYQLNTQQLVKRIIPGKYLSGKGSYKPTVFCKNFDSIFVRNNRKTLSMLDSSGHIKKTINYPDVSSHVIAFKTNRPLVVKNGIVFAGIRPSGTLTTLKKLKQWKTMNVIDFNNSKIDKLYFLPESYRNNLYGYHFMNYSYCFNDRGNFVFSFPADSSLYETNLTDFHIAHYGKSKFQQGPISPVNEEDLDRGDGSKQYHIRDAYGAVYFDPFHKIYLRYFRQKTSESGYDNNKREVKESVLIFNNNLQIIGESPIPESVSFSNLFITANGRIFAQVDKKDENALHFVQIKLNYNDLPDASIQITQK
ncbi:DUF4221 family protein [Longitalea arenae]|uniref:DUF4221 family protein n=1 Tax=Longitalea arenae TaxID=2812558 RepID=UPI0019678227|nr:DUF4221 family protein [Longitalea arenae]